MGNLLIYSAAEIFCAWRPALPRFLARHLPMQPRPRSEPLCRLPVGEAPRAAAWATRTNLMTQHAHNSGAQVLPPARATVPPSLRESSSRVSSLLACYALGPLASAAQYSCRREPCTGRSAWLLLGRACLSAWIEHRSGEQRSP